ncbi:MAG TPA: hypothetical protein VFG36_05725, partial [Methanoregula sp.]|nr:hypothetical protein [Methanoregula sp.]
TVFIEDNDRKIVPDATIFINNNKSGVTDDHGQFTTKIRFNTLYNITATKDAYQTVSIQKQFALGNDSVSLTLVMQKNLDLGFVTLIVSGAVGILVVFGVIRMYGGRKRRHVMRKNDI